jgi:hypothetical protein
MQHTHNPFANLLHFQHKKIHIWRIKVAKTPQECCKHCNDDLTMYDNP